MIDWEQIVDIQTIAERLEVEPETVQDWWEGYDAFPMPRHTLPSTPLWFWADVELWAEVKIGYDPYAEPLR